MVDGCPSKMINVMSGVPLESLLCPQLFLLHSADHFPMVENKFYGYADDSTLVAVVSSPAERVAVTETMNRDLNRVSVWCHLWGMKLNAGKTTTMIFFRSHGLSPVNPIDTGWSCAEEIS